MPSPIRVIGVVGIVAIGVLTPTWGPELLSGVAAFRARDLVFEGRIYVPEAEVVALAGIGPTTSVWTSLEELESRLREHPLIRTVEIERELPDRLVIRLGERVPVALVPTPTLRPVDREGRYLPIDPAEWQLDLPLIEPRVEPGREKVAPRPDRLRSLAGLAAEMMGDAVFWTRVSTIREREGGGIVAEWVTPEVAFHLDPGTTLRKLQRGVRALTAELASPENGLPRAVDLRWADQVYVCSRSGRSRSECEDI